MKLFSVLAAFFLCVELCLSQPPLQDGFPVYMEGNGFSSPIVVDVDGNGDMEIVVASMDDKVHIFNHDGSVFEPWPMITQPGPPQCPTETSSPAAADIDGDGTMEIFFGSNDGNLYGWTCAGEDLPGFPVSLGNGVVRCSATIVDIDGDGDFEILIGTGVSQYRFYAFHHNGQLVDGFPINVAWLVHSTPAVGDVDGDGAVEIVFGTDGNGARGYVYAIESTGQTLPGWPRLVGHHVDSSPALVELDATNDGLEIVVGCIDGYIYAWHSDGTNLPAWPYRVSGGSVYEGVISSPAIAVGGDLDAPQIAIGQGIIQSSSGKMHLIAADAYELPGFPIQCSGSVTGCPVIGNLDDDADFEITFGDQASYFHALNPDASELDGFPVRLGTEGITSCPWIGDLDLDGDVELMVAAGEGSLYVWDFATEFDSLMTPWPCFHHDHRHTGNISSGVSATPPARGLHPAAEFELLSIWPNPFNSETRIRFRLTKGSEVSLTIFNILGEPVETLAERYFAPGTYEYDWRPCGRASALYYCSIECASGRDTQRLVFVR